MIQNHVKFNNYSIYMNMKNFKQIKIDFDNLYVTYSNLKIGYKCLVSLFPPSNVDIIYSYLYMSFLNLYYITLCRLHEKIQS
jgi:hypothetical protein